MYFDTHCHLNSEQMFENRDEFIKKALNHGVSHMCVVGYSLASSIKAVQIAREYPMVYAAVGIGPEDCLATDAKELQELEKLLIEDKVVALGEIGLDYHWDTVPKEKQITIFETQLALAEKYHLPVVIHSRDALQDTYEILKKAKAHGIMHCYSGSAEMAKEFVKIGFKISLAGPVTFKNARVPKEVAKMIELKDLLIETDSPYLTPHPFRGKPNDPSYVIYVAKEIAAVKQMSEEAVALQTERNAFEVFQIAKEEL